MVIIYVNILSNIRRADRLIFIDHHCRPCLVIDGLCTVLVCYCATLSKLYSCNIFSKVVLFFANRPGVKENDSLTFSISNTEVMALLEGDRIFHLSADMVQGNQARC